MNLKKSVENKRRIRRKNRREKHGRNPTLSKHLSTHSRRNDLFTTRTPNNNGTSRRVPRHEHKKKCQSKYKRLKERKGDLTKSKQFVRNFSSHHLTIPEIKVLAKGLKFIPYPGQPQNQALIAVI